MRCERFETCEFYKISRNKISDCEYDLLISSYCEGALHEKCKRLKYWREHGEAAPVEMNPLGYHVLTLKKLYD